MRSSINRGPQDKPQICYDPGNGALDFWKPQSAPCFKDPAPQHRLQPEVPRRDRNRQARIAALFWCPYMGEVLLFWVQIMCP